MQGEESKGEKEGRKEEVNMEIGQGGQRDYCYEGEHIGNSKENRK